MFPFGGSGSTYKKQGLIYKNVKAFDLGVGSRVRFDLYAPNDYDIIMDVAMASTVNNGDWEVPKNSWVTICRNCNVGRGDDVRNNHELTFTTNADEYRFPGGGLAVRFIVRCASDRVALAARAADTRAPFACHAARRIVHQRYYLHAGAAVCQPNRRRR